MPTDLPLTGREGSTGIIVVPLDPEETDVIPPPEAALAAFKASWRG